MPPLVRFDAFKFHRTLPVRNFLRTVAEAYSTVKNLDASFDAQGAVTCNNISIISRISSTPRSHPERIILEMFNSTYLLLQCDADADQ